MTDPSAVSALKPAFRFPFETRQATNRFLAGAGLLILGMFIPILPTLFVLGYGVQVLRRAARREPPTMHAWDDWGAMLKDGFRGWAIVFMFFLPAFLVIIVGFTVYFGVVVAISAEQPTEGSFLLLMLALGSLFLSLSLSTLLMAAASIPLPVALAHFAVEERFAAAFHFRAWWPILRRNLLGALIAWVVIFGLMGVVYIATLVVYYTLVLICLLFFALLPAYFYVLLVAGALYGDVYAEGRAAATAA